MNDRERQTVHNRKGAQAQQAAYAASPYRFRIFYRWRHSTGWGDGHTDLGVQSTPLPDSELKDLIERTRLVIAAEVQADGVRFDPQSLVIEVDRVEPLD